MWHEKYLPRQKMVQFLETVALAQAAWLTHLQISQASHNGLGSMKKIGKQGRDEGDVESEGGRWKLKLKE